VLKFFFGSGRRVWVTFLGIQLVFQVGGFCLQSYILGSCTSPGFALVLLGGWFAMGVAAGLGTGVWLGFLSGGEIFLADLVRDEMAEFDARIDGIELPETIDDDNEAVMMQRIRGGGKFTLYWGVGLISSLLCANIVGGQFLQTFSHPGLAIIQLRNDDPNLRRRGIEALLLKSTDRREKMIAEVVRQALSDPSEGVVARAIHAAGQLSLGDVIPQLETFAANEGVLTFSALMSLGLMTETDDLGNVRPNQQARKAIQRLSTQTSSRKEAEALAYAIGLLKVPAFGVLRSIYESASHERERLASVWASAQLKDRRLARFFEMALSDSELSVQCAAINALEHLALPESAPVLMSRFESLVECTGEGEKRTCEPRVPFTCPEIAIPVQEGGAIRLVVKRRDLFLAIVRALSATEHPELLTWLVQYQLKSETNYLTWLLMSKVYEHMQNLDRDGTLSTIRQRLRQIELLRINPTVSPTEGSQPSSKTE
jgi:HEAT repeat protein